MAAPPDIEQPIPASVSLRQAVDTDAGDLIGLVRSVDREASFALRAPDEVLGTADQMREMIEVAGELDNQLLLVAEADGAPIGYLFAQGGGFRSVAGVANIKLGVRAAWTGKGVGTRLMTEVEQWARAAGIWRLELTVVTENRAAVRLYERTGYEREGVRRHAVRIADRLYDELMMAKLL